MLKITGYSDDLIVADGDINEEYDAVRAPADGTLVAIEGGVVLRVNYNHDGIWRIVPVVNPEGSGLSIEQAPENDEDNYTDIATIDRTVAWVQVGNTITHNRNAAAVAQVQEIAGRAGIEAEVTR